MNRCWVTRDKSGLMAASVWIYPPGTKKPKVNEMASHQHHRGLSARFCHVGFKTVTGIEVGFGDCIQVEFSARVI